LEVVFSTLLATGFACIFSVLVDSTTEDFTVFCLETFSDLTVPITFATVFCFLTVTGAVFGPLEGLTFFLRQLSLLPVLLLSLLPALLL
jgi:hypothetical protein